MRRAAVFVVGVVVGAAGLYVALVLSFAEVDESRNGPQVQRGPGGPWRT